MFSLSPSVQLKEIEISSAYSNIPINNVGMVLRADRGECDVIKRITNESELVYNFGKPTAINYLDWFNAWNFLQYAGSLYVVRPLPKDVPNKHVTFENVNVIWGSTYGFYNKDLAKINLETFQSDGITVFDRNVTNNSDLAIAICSSSYAWKRPIFAESFIKCMLDNSYHTEINTNKVYSDTQPANMKVGQEVLLNFNKKVKIESIICTDRYEITLSESIVPKDIDKYVIDVVSVSGNTITFNPETSLFEVGSYFGGLEYEYPSNGFTVLSITNATATIQKYGNPSFGLLTSNITLYTGTVDVLQTVPDTDRIYMDQGFNFVPGSELWLNDEIFEVVDVNYEHGYLTVDRPCSRSAHKLISVLNVWQPLLFSSNRLDELFDANIIQTEKVTIDEGYQYNKQKLISFNSLYEYEPAWNEGEFVLVVLHKQPNGLYNIVESHMISTNPRSRNHNGKNIYADDYIYENSNYIYCKVKQNSSVNTTDVQFVKFEDYAIPQYTYVKYDIVNAMSLYANDETLDINILMSHELDMNSASLIARTRKDCIAVVCPYDYNRYSVDTVDRLIEDFGAYDNFYDILYGLKTFTEFSTYSVIYGNMKYQYDKFNDMYRWVSFNGDVAGLIVSSSPPGESWWPPAGLNRGHLNNVSGIMFKPTKSDLERLLLNSINPIIMDTKEGVVTWGQDTATTVPSAFDRIHVRRMVMTVEKFASTLANRFVFEFNDEFNRKKFKGAIEPFLIYIRGRGGLVDYRVICDTSNNTPQVIDNNGMILDIYLKPSDSLEFVRLNVFVANTSVSFKEIFD